LKKRITIISILLVLVMLIIPAAAFAYDSELVLENKDGAWNEITGDNTAGLLSYNSAAPAFDYEFSATGLEVETSYDLIYYADPWESVSGFSIDTFVTDIAGDIAATTGDMDTGDLPVEADDNYPTGAKIWLVPSSDYEDGAMAAWNPSSYLFEHNLITYTKVTPEDEPDAYAGDANEFTVAVLGDINSKASYEWVEAYAMPQVLAEAVHMEGSELGVDCVLDIPAGTEITFPYRPGTRVTNLLIKIVNGQIIFMPANMDFSQECTLTVNGEVITFTEIRGGIPQ